MESTGARVGVWVTGLVGHCIERAMSVFEAYDSEYQSLSQELNKKLAEFRNSDVG